MSQYKVSHGYTKRIRPLLIIAALAAAGLAAAWSGLAAADDTGMIHLDKDQAIQLIRLQIQVETASRIRDEYVIELYNAARTTPDQHSLNISIGAFLPVVASLPVNEDTAKLPADSEAP